MLSLLASQARLARASPPDAAKEGGAVGAVRSRAEAIEGCAAPAKAQRARTANGRRRRRRGRAVIRSLLLLLGHGTAPRSGMRRVASRGTRSPRRDSPFGKPPDALGEGTPCVDGRTRRGLKNPGTPG